MRRIPLILFAEHAAADERNAQRVEVRLAGDAIIGMSDLGRIMNHTRPFIEIGGRLLAIEYQEIAVSENIAGRDGNCAGQAHGL